MTDRWMDIDGFHCSLSTPELLPPPKSPRGNMAGIYLDSVDTPFMVFRFRYRTRGMCCSIPSPFFSFFFPRASPAETPPPLHAAAHQNIGLIPRSPSPVRPPTPDPMENMSREELMEALKMLKKVSNRIPIPLSNLGD